MLGLDPNNPAPLAPALPEMSVGGIMPIMSQAQVDAQDRKRATLGQEAPAIQGLAHHVRAVWETVRLAKIQTVEPRMLANLRVRRGEYDPEELTAIRQQGGSEIYMMVGSTKCRAAGSWVRDILVATREEKPWTLKPSPVPELPPDAVAQLKAQATEQVAQMIMATGQIPEGESLRQMLELMRDEFLTRVRDEAFQRTERMEHKMEDQLVEGGFLRALNDFIDDLTTFPTALVKGPIIRRKPRMKWVQDPETGWTLDVQQDLVLEWERVDPFMFYPHPALTDLNDALPVIERHRMTRTAISEMLGVEGYDDAAIRAVLDEYGKGGLHEWLNVDTAKAQAEGRSTTHMMNNSAGTIDALQFFGPVQGKMLREWGMSETDVPDAVKEYHCEVWLIGRWVIKATLNYDPLGRKPYYATSYERVPGTFWGNSVIDLCMDSQKMCNAAARAIANNMGIASGPQAFVNVDRLPAGEDVTNMFPWKIWQTTNDPMGGGGGDPIKFFQPQSNAQELMTIFQQFSVRADEDTGVPRYMTGESPTGGAGRTASGLSMLLGNASKTIKQVVSNVDFEILTPVLERLYDHNMKYSDDAELKGDINVVARGAVSIMLKESAQVRRNEFLAMVGQSPVLSQIVGPEGIAELVREAAKTLDMPNVDRLVPSPEKLKMMAQMNQAMQAQQAPLANTPPGINNGGQNLTNGAPITDNM